MVNNILWDLAYFGGSCLTDFLSTYKVGKNKGLNGENGIYESNIGLRESIKKNGLEKTLIKAGLMVFVTNSLCGLGFLCIDSISGIKDNSINFHHAYLYGVGTIKYLASASNMLFMYNHDKLASVVGKPVDLFLESLNFIYRKKFYD